MEIENNNIVTLKGKKELIAMRRYYEDAEQFIHQYPKEAAS